MSRARQYVTCPAICHAPGNMSRARQYVMCPRICHVPGNMSRARQYVTSPAICHVLGNMSRAREYVTCPAICHVHPTKRWGIVKCIVNPRFNRLQFTVYSKNPIYCGIWGRENPAVNWGSRLIRICLFVFTNKWLKRGKENDRGNSRFAVNRVR